MPDFDIDFCMEGRDRVIEYVSQRYGSDRVSQIITYGTMAAKAVVRDVGRVLGHPYGFADRIAKLIPFEVGITLDKALSQEKELRELYESDDEVRAVIDLARQLEGLVRNAGKHAGVASSSRRRRLRTSRRCFVSKVRNRVLRSSTRMTSRRPGSSNLISSGCEL